MAMFVLLFLVLLCHLKLSYLEVSAPLLVVAWQERLLWAKDQHAVCRFIIACLDRMSSH